MGKTIERDVKREVKKLLDRHGAYYYMLVPTGYGRRGVPDFLICHDGRFLAVETKAQGRRPTPQQKRELDAVEDAGGKAMVVDEYNLHELKKWLIFPEGVER